jgi:hypothetical protein
MRFATAGTGLRPTEAHLATLLASAPPAAGPAAWDRPPVVPNARLDDTLNVGIVTAAFLGLTSRPDDYYIRPAEDLYRQSPVPAFIFTQPEHRHRFAAPTHPADPDLLANAFWRPGWRELYQKLIRRNPTHCYSRQRHYPRVLGAWLGKFELLRRVFDDPGFGRLDALLWWDAGFSISFHLGHDPGRYSGFEIDPGLAVTSLRELLRCPLALVHCPFGVFHMPAAWMEPYRPAGRAAADLAHPAMFMFVRRDAFDELHAGVREAWARLIADGKAGTEENALTLYAWGRDVRSFDSVGWERMLGFGIH